MRTSIIGTLAAASVCILTSGIQTVLAVQENPAKKSTR